MNVWTLNTLALWIGYFTSKHDTLTALFTEGDLVLYSMFKQEHRFFTSQNI